MRSLKRGMRALKRTMVRKPSPEVTFVLRETLSSDARRWAEANGLQFPFGSPDVAVEPHGGYVVTITEEKWRNRSAVCHYRKDGTRDWYELSGGLHG